MNSLMLAWLSIVIGGVGIFQIVDDSSKEYTKILDLKHQMLKYLDSVQLWEISLFGILLFLGPYIIVGLWEWIKAVLNRVLINIKYILEKIYHIKDFEECIDDRKVWVVLKRIKEIKKRENIIKKFWKILTDIKDKKKFLKNNQKPLIASAFTIIIVVLFSTISNSYNKVGYDCNEVDNKAMKSLLCDPINVFIVPKFIYDTISK